MTSTRRVSDLLAAATAALSRRDSVAALNFLREADTLDPQNLDIYLQTALAHRMGGDFISAIAFLDQVLALDPYHFLALISKALLTEKTAGKRAAASIYKNALKIAPPSETLPTELQTMVLRASSVIDDIAIGLESHLRMRTANLRSSLERDRLARFDESLSVFSGRSRVFTQDPLLLHYTRLPAIPFLDRALFPWLPELEAHTESIRSELEGLLAHDLENFAPYIAYPKWAPVNQWAELNHSRRWSSAWLWRDGERIDAACDLCPKTVALMERLPVLTQPGFSPTVVFSALDARTKFPRIPDRLIRACSVTCP